MSDEKPEQQTVTEEPKPLQHPEVEQYGPAEEEAAAVEETAPVQVPAEEAPVQSDAFEPALLSLAARMGMTEGEARSYATPTLLEVELSRRIYAAQSAPPQPQSTPTWQPKLDLPTEGEEGYDAKLVEAVERNLAEINRRADERIAALEKKFEADATSRQKNMAGAIERRFDDWIAKNENWHGHLGKVKGIELSHAAPEYAARLRTLRRAMTFAAEHMQDQGCPWDAVPYEQCFEEAAYSILGGRIKEGARQEVQNAISERRARGIPRPTARRESPKRGDAAAIEEERVWAAKLGYKLPPSGNDEF